MDIVQRAKNIMLTPKTEWPLIAAEEPDLKMIFKGYVLPLALVPAVAHLIGLGVIGKGMMSSFSWGIAVAFIQLLLAFVGIYLSAWAIALLGPRFASREDIGRAVQLVAYSCTPAWVAGILFIVPALAALGFLGGIYGFFLMYLGLPHLMNTPQEKAMKYLAVSILVVIVINWTISMVLTSIVFSMFGLNAMTTVSGT